MNFLIFLIITSTQDTCAKVDINSLNEEESLTLEKTFVLSQLTYFNGPSRFSYSIFYEEKNGKEEISIITTEFVSFDYSKQYNKSKDTSYFKIHIELKVEKYKLRALDEEAWNGMTHYNSKAECFEKNGVSEYEKSIWDKKKTIPSFLNGQIESLEYLLHDKKESRRKIELVAYIIQDLLDQNGNSVNRALKDFQKIFSKDGYRHWKISREIRPLDDDEPDKSGKNSYTFFDGESGLIDDKATTLNFDCLFIYVKEFLPGKDMAGGLNLKSSPEPYEKASNMTMHLSEDSISKHFFLNRCQLLNGNLDQDKRDSQILSKILRMNFGKETISKSPMLAFCLLFCLYSSTMLGGLFLFNGRSSQEEQ